MEKFSVYHGSLVGNISSFNACSHFGTRLQVLVCIAAHKLMDNDPGDIPYLYRCTLTVPFEALVGIPDWKTPKIMGGLRAYLLHHGRDAQFQTYYRNLRDLEPADAQCLVLLRDEMTQYGHRVIRYSNDVEESGTSYMVLHPSDIKLDSCTAPTWDDVLVAFKQIRPENFGLHISC